MNEKNTKKSPITFTIQKELAGTLGRAGTLETPHGTIQTPSFVTVGTKGTVKAVTPEMLVKAGIQVVLANTYHLYLQPGDVSVRQWGGFPKMMNWHGPSMTDSGGYQVFSLGAAYGKGIKKILETNSDLFLEHARSDETEKPKLAHIGSDGVTFKSHIDGSLHYFTPERSVEIQHNLGADMIFVFDECTSPLETYEYQKESLSRTHAWGKRCLDYHHSRDNAERQALFGIVQGGRHEDLRKESARVIAEMKTSEGYGFDGFGIGGSFSKEDLGTAVKWVNESLPKEKPRHLLGIGEPRDLFEGVQNGVDLFDCVAPTRIARNGALYTKDGQINIFNEQYKEDLGKIDESCGCYTCQNYTRAYVAHLFRAKEMLGGTLATIHNLYFINHLVKDIRQSILDDRFFELKEEFLGRFYKSSMI